MNEDWFRCASEEVLGDFGEQLWEHVFVESNVRYVPMHRIEIGRAPVLQGKDKTVLPDFGCHHFKWQAAVDSKCKKSAVFFYKAKQHRHGIDYRKWEQYSKFAEQTRQPAGLAIVECFKSVELTEWSGALLFQSLDALGRPCESVNKAKFDVAFWPRALFLELGAFSPAELAAMHLGSKVPSFEDKLVDVFCGRIQQRGLFT